jgi:polar amino acid transport system substrate-binding protein
MARTRFGATLFFVFLAGVMILAACPALAASSLDEIKSKGELAFGTDATMPPFEYVDKDGKIVGAEIELGEELAKRMGLKAKFINMAWDGIFLAMDAKRCDVIISSVSITPRRQQTYDFSIPYKDSAQVLVVRKQEQNIKSKDDLKGKVIGCQLGTVAETEAKKLEGVTIKAYSTYSEPFMELDFERVHAIVSNKSTANAFLARHPDKYKIIGDDLIIQYQGIVIRKGEKDLKEAIDKALKTMIDDGFIKELRKKHQF